MGDDAEHMASEDFYTDLPSFDGFQRIADPDAYAPLPNDWTIGISDVVSSTEAIRLGRYKAVNTAGAAVISAVSNALGTLDFPYVFTGDGMCYAVGPRQAAAARNALGASVGWVGSELGLVLRGGEIGVDAIRRTGRDVRVARFAPSPDVVYAMFSGGGLSWAESELKEGRLASVVAPPGTRPDLDGLSCRFSPIKARHGLMLSLIVCPRGDRHDAAFQALVDDVLGLVDGSREVARPVPAEGLPLAWPPQGFAGEARLQRRLGQSLVASQIRVGLRTLVSTLIMQVGRDIGSFSPARYRTQLAHNSDYRKFEDRLMMTLDCSPALALRIEARLTEAHAAGIAEFGLHRQDSALVTCVVPSPTRPDHVHFVDGASGGYALAALELKRSRGHATSVQPSRPLEPETIP